jgi:integrase
MIPLRGVFGFHFQGEKALKNPLAGIKNRKRLKKLPDPLTRDERDRILADMQAYYDPRIWAYYQFAFYTGMRPEEIIALRWSDIDFNAAIARVQRVRTFKGSERDGSKTHSERDVDLVTPAFEALEAMRPFTCMKGKDVFENPVTGRPWHDERSQRDHYWKPTLARLKIRKRRPYCTRHTYCTVALMARIRPAYIAAQAGHSLKMLLEVYARWIPEDDGGREKAALEAAMGPKVPQKFPNDSSVIGRRDWTRTNDPHHVKVVL